MLDLAPIKDRLLWASSWPWEYDKSGRLYEKERSSGCILRSGAWGSGRRAGDRSLILNAPADLAALIAEVEVLRRALLGIEGMIEGWTDMDVVDIGVVRERIRLALAGEE